MFFYILTGGFGVVTAGKTEWQYCMRSRICSRVWGCRPLSEKFIIKRFNILTARLLTQYNGS